MIKYLIIALAVTVIAKSAHSEPYPFACLTGNQGVNEITLSGAYGLTQYRPNDPEGQIPQPSYFDARNATWQFANSKNNNPVPGYDCNNGTDPVQPYPIIVNYQKDGCWSGGKVSGNVKWSWDWDAAYCNGAGWMCGDDCNGFVLEGIRIDGVWDGIRINQDYDTQGVIRHVWVSNVRDDCVENDDMNHLLIEDSLFDKCYMFLSARRSAIPTAMRPYMPNCTGTNNDYIPINGDPDCANPYEITLKNVLVRIHGGRHYRESTGIDYAYWAGEIYKSTYWAPPLNVTNSVFAMDFYFHETFYSSILETWELINAASTQCANNYFLWLASDSLPAGFPPPPSCFTVETGRAAREHWQTVRSAWIREHSDIARLPGDQPPRP